MKIFVASAVALLVAQAYAESTGPSMAKEPCPSPSPKPTHGKGGFMEYEEEYKKKKDRVDVESSFGGGNEGKNPYIPPFDDDIMDVPDAPNDEANDEKSTTEDPVDEEIEELIAEDEDPTKAEDAEEEDDSDAYGGKTKYHAAHEHSSNSKGNGGSNNGAANGAETFPVEGEQAHGAHTKPSDDQDGGPKTNAADKRPVLNNSGVNRHPFSTELRDYIVEKHNWARGHLVPTEASNMRELSWDESLAISASDLVETCRFEHFTEGYSYGQNLILQSGQMNKEAIDKWMVEWVTKEISESDRRGQGMMDLDHASAVLWANTYLVGCASKLCNGKYLTACNYFTQGNWAGEKTYEPGRSCSRCPSQAPRCDVTGRLCTYDPNARPVPFSPAIEPASESPEPGNDPDHDDPSSPDHELPDAPEPESTSSPDHAKTPCPPSEVSEEQVVTPSAEGQNGTEVQPANASTEMPTPAPSTPHEGKARELCT